YAYPADIANVAPPRAQVRLVLVERFCQRKRHVALVSLPTRGLGKPRTSFLLCLSKRESELTIGAKDVIGDAYCRLSPQPAFNELGGPDATLCAPAVAERAPRRDAQPIATGFEL